MPETYTVIRRSSSSWSLLTGEGEILGTGGEWTEPARAVVEMDARNLLLPEGACDRWEVEPEIVFSLDACEFGAEDVYDFLIEKLGVSPEAAAHLIS